MIFDRQRRVHQTSKFKNFESTTPTACCRPLDIIHTPWNRMVGTHTNSAKPIGEKYILILHTQSFIYVNTMHWVCTAMSHPLYLTYNKVTLGQQPRNPIPPALHRYRETKLGVGEHAYRIVGLQPSHVLIAIPGFSAFGLDTLSTMYCGPST